MPPEWIFIQSQKRHPLNNAEGREEREPAGEDLSALREADGLAQGMG